MNEKKKSVDLIKGIGIYGIGTFGTKFLSFLIVPLYTYYITTSDMGIYDILISTISLLTPVITMQISDAAYRWIIREDVLDKEKYIRATYQVLLFNCFIAVVIISIVNKLYPISYCSYFCLILVLSRAFETTQKILRGLKKQKIFALVGIVHTCIFLLLNVAQLCFLKKGVESLFISSIISLICSLLFVVLLVPELRIRLNKKTDIKLVFEMYRYSVPLVPNYLSWWVINSSDRYIVLFYLGNSANGILAVAHKFPTIMQSVLGLFNNSWQDISVADSERDVGKYYTKVFREYSRLALTILLPLIPATKIVCSIILSESYKVAGNYIAFYYLGAVFQSFSSYYGVGYLRSTKTGKAFLTSVYGAIINATVNLLCIRIIGIHAAAFSTFVGFLIMWLIRERQNRYELQIKVDWKQVILLTLLNVIISIISIKNSIIGNVVIFTLGIIVFGIYNIDMIKQVSSVISNKLKRK